VAWGQCIEQHGAGEAFLPILDALGRLCRGPEGEQIIGILRQQAPMWLVQLPAFITPEEVETLQRKVQGDLRERTLRELAAALEVLAAEHPLVQCQQFLKRLGVEEWPDGTLAAHHSLLHALYQQLWHERVTPTQLQHYHLQIGERKAHAYREQGREIAAELASDLSKAETMAKRCTTCSEQGRMPYDALRIKKQLGCIRKG
jgi:hypothetical protein